MVEDETTRGFRGTLLDIRVVDLDSPSAVYHENSKFELVDDERYYGVGEVAVWPRFPRAPPPGTPSGPPKSEAELRREYDWKRYDLSESTDIPDGVEEDLAPELAPVIRRRRSRRRFGGDPLELRELGALLELGYGVTDPVDGYRAVPSGGAKYPLEIYVLLYRGTEDLPRGIYHYDPIGSSLEHLPSPEGWDDLDEVFFEDPNHEGAAGVLLVSGVFNRSQDKYGQRGYRFVLLEAGHVMQNLALAAEAMDLGLYPVGGFADRQLEDLLGIDGTDESLLYGAVFGHRERPPADR